MSPSELEKLTKYQNAYGLAGSEYVISINAQSKEAAAAGIQTSTYTRKQEPIRRRAVILTALQDEYNAVRGHLMQLEEDEHSEGTIYERGIFEASGGSWEVWIAEIGAGNDDAAMEAERAIRHARPSVALFVGVAGGVKSVKLGDVVVAEKVADYESGKDEAEFFTRPDVGQSSYKLVQRAKFERKKEDWLQRLNLKDGEERPEVRVGGIAAGGKVVSSTRAATAQLLKTRYNDALAVEMEGRGFLTATHANPSVRALIVRGISDLLDDKTEAADKSWQPRAARNASAFAFEILAKLSQPATD